MAVFNRRKKLLILLWRKKLLLLRIILFLNLKTKRNYTPKRWWKNPIWQNRDKEGDYETLIQNMRQHDPCMFKTYTRMCPEQFDHLLSIVGPKIQKKKVIRDPIPPGLRLALTLRYLATGNCLWSLAFSFRVGKATAHNIIKETTKALWDCLQPRYMPMPDENAWNAVAIDYSKVWNFPLCCGSVDGKHVMIQQPAKSGTQYHNYKGFNSIVLMATVDAKYKFIIVDIGGFGSHSDGGIFKSSPFGNAVQNGSVDFPPPKCLPNTMEKLPHVLLGDEAFQLLPNFMRPFPGTNLNSERRVFNYRLSRARRCSENAFGIMAARWRVFRKPIMMKPKNVDNVVKACTVLHNYLMTEEMKSTNKVYCPPGFSDSVDPNGNLVIGEFENALREDPNAGLLDHGACSAGRNYSMDAAKVRNVFTKYFSSKEGEVSWQWNLPGVEIQPENIVEM